MSIIENATSDSCQIKIAEKQNAWILSGPTQNGEPIVEVHVDEHPFTIGRNSGLSLRLQFSTVSGHHASLWLNQQKLMLKDENSTNGTFLNGERLEKEVPVQIGEEDLIHFAEAPFRVRCESTGNLTPNCTVAKNVCDKALALVQFDRLMSEKLVKPHFQPIIQLDQGTTVGFELLGRGRVFGLELVAAMFKAAEQLSVEVELSEMLRWEGTLASENLESENSDVSPTLFVNTHPREMENTAELIRSMAKLRELVPDTPLVLEIHESSITSPAQMRSISSDLKNLDIALAYDDFGAGQARLAELMESSPDYVKFDISLIRGIDSCDRQRQQMVETLVTMVHDLEIRTLAEGVETEAEADTCRELGFDLGQGYFYGRPFAR
ncbi:MAG: EAL domain-containing protein [Rubripirellula sp.]|nr:EAL domain-containing protein [Rubripirellula sp.]